MLVFREEVRVADFGSAFAAVDFLRPPEVAPLTTAYARSPDAWLWDQYGLANDAWGCGVCALALWSGAAPFPAVASLLAYPEMIRSLGLPPAEYIREAGPRWHPEWEQTVVASCCLAAAAGSLGRWTFAGVVEGLLRWQATSLPIPISIWTYVTRVCVDLRIKYLSNWY